MGPSMLDELVDSGEGPNELESLPAMSGRQLIDPQTTCRTPCPTPQSLLVAQTVILTGNQPGSYEGGGLPVATNTLTVVGMRGSHAGV